jgi:hypothetical protein
VEPSNKPTEAEDGVTVGHGRRWAEAERNLTDHIHVRRQAIESPSFGHHHFFNGCALRRVPFKRGICGNVLTPKLWLFLLNQ